MKVSFGTKFGLSIIFAFLISLTFASAQDEEPTFVVIDYMKVEPGNEEAYLVVEKVWKKIHAARVKAGQMEYWELSRLLSPYGTSLEYNYKTANIYKGNKKLADHFTGSMSDLSDILTEEEIKILNTTNSVRDLVKEEVYVIDLEVFRQGADNKIIVDNYMQLQEGASLAEHSSYEKEVWLPVHKARIDDGNMEGWANLNLVMPQGDDKEYHAVTVDFYESLDQYMMPWFDKYFAKVHPGKDLGKMSEEMEKIWIRRRVDVQIRIDYVGN
ncbi:MAG: hypothetical protein AAFR87_06905 [Bacteroidota bacterium]